MRFFRSDKPVDWGPRGEPVFWDGEGEPPPPLGERAQVPGYATGGNVPAPSGAGQPSEEGELWRLARTLDGTYNVAHGRLLEVGQSLLVVPAASLAGGVEERDRWIRLFNRLEAAVSRHIKAKSDGAFSDDADEALHDAHAKVLKAAALSTPEEEG